MPFQKGFYIQGTQVLDATGESFIMRGVSHAHTWFKQDLSLAIPAISATKANIVRIVLSNGLLYTKDEATSVSQIIDICSRNKLITMLEVHDGTGSDDIEVLKKIANYWIEIKDVLIGLEDRVIINIANEWFSKNDAISWAQGYKEVIPLLRQAGLNHLFVVDCAGWGQYPETIPAEGKNIFLSDNLKNTIFSIHMYENAGRNSEVIKNAIDNALSINVPVIVGEFGHSHDNYVVDSDTILNYSQTKNIGWLAWSWYGNNAEANFLDLCYGPNGSLTSWGTFIVNSNFGINNTSIICNIFNSLL